MGAGNIRKNENNPRDLPSIDWKLPRDAKKSTANKRAAMTVGMINQIRRKFFARAKPTIKGNMIIPIPIDKIMVAIPSVMAFAVFRMASEKATMKIAANKD